MRNDVCDFCECTMPLWTVLCSKEIMDFPIIQSKDWAACSKCVEFIKDKNLDGLIDCVSSRGNFPVSPAFKKRLQWLYGEIFNSIVSITEDGLTSTLTGIGL